MTSDLTSLISCLEKELINGKSSLTASSNSIDKLFDMTDCESIVYWKDKTSSQIYLGLGVYKQVPNIESYTQETKLLDYHSFGGHFFEEESHKTNLWSDFSKFHFIIPEYLIIQNDNKIELLKYDEKAKPLAEYFDFSAQILTAKPTLKSAVELPTKVNWLKSIIQLKTKLNEKFNKVVLSKMTTLNLSSVINSKKVFITNKNLMSNCHHFYISPKPDIAFFSLTPETLYKKENSVIDLEAIAGTRPRSSDLSQDKKYGDELINSPKEQEEHQIVFDMIKDLTKELGRVTKGKQKLLKLKNVQHLYTPLKIETKGQESALKLISLLHPTPAVGGFPQAEAKEYINKNEGYERGLFAAPIGHISKEKEELAVGIRSALVIKDQAHVFAGCGIVKGSDPESEWDEITVKTKYLIDSFYE